MAILTKTGDSVSTGSQSSVASWQQEMKAAIRDADSLLRLLGLPRTNHKIRGARQFPVFAPPAFIDRMKHGDPDDPLLRQVLPVMDEDQSPAHFSLDPLGESNVTVQPGLIQKYRGRVLLITTGACAIHCRYCFRRHFPYQETPRATDEWRRAFDQIAADHSISEVILSGGDPLSLVDARLAELVSRLEAIPHLRRLRIHSRLPVVIPSRVTDELIQIMNKTRLKTVFVIHSNHANELDTNVAKAIQRLRAAQFQVLNQTVLLRGINDHSTALITLSERLLDCGVLPYYLHQLDPVVGASHFEVPIEDGIRLVQEMRAALPGYGVPRYVQEISGEPAKTVLA